MTKYLSGLIVVVLMAADSLLGGETQKKYFDDYPMPKPAPVDTQSKARDSGAYGGLPTVDYIAVASANARVAGSRAEISRIEGAMSVRQSILRQNFENSEEVVKAQADLSAAHEEMDSARRLVAHFIANNPEYKAAIAERDALAKVLAAGRQSAKDREATATKKLEFATIAGRIEAEALKQEPKFQAAQSKLTMASAKLSQMKAQYDMQVRNDAELKALRDQLGEARVLLAAAEGYLAGVVATYNQLANDYDYFTRRFRYYYSPYNGMYRSYSPYTWWNPGSYSPLTPNSSGPVLTPF